ncbi:MAG: Gfo/Idh/MocA family oxidoreductase [Kiritimatiellia bacterium]|nr:Gfo/Idh/MocA family oxidoreductase [Kiritimatiellia bacterium]
MKDSVAVSRRAFLAGAGALAAVPSITLGQGQRVFKYAVVGCGGRGSGAVRDIRAAAERLGHKAELVAAADFFQDKAAAVCKANGCDPKFAFGGAAGYRKIMETDAEIVLLTAPPIFRPLHLEACVQAGKHIFAEKPIATDAAGLRHFLKGVAEAKAKNLSILSGTLHRHSNRFLRQIKPIREGAIGRILAGQVYRCHGGIWVRPRREGESNAGYLCNNWYHFWEMSGDQITEQAIHEVDLANWFIGRFPKTAMAIGGRHRRPAGIGNIYDCMAIDYDYGDAVHVQTIGRHIKGCSDRCGTLLVGSEGEAACGGKITRFDGKPVAYDEERIKDRHENGMIMEHADFLQGILSGALLNEGEQVAMSTATTIMGTFSAYSGRTVRMSDLLENKDSEFYSMNAAFTAADFERDTDVPMPAEGVAAVPGKA